MDTVPSRKVSELEGLDVLHVLQVRCVNMCIGPNECHRIFQTAKQVNSVDAQKIYEYIFIEINTTK